MTKKKENNYYYYPNAALRRGVCHCLSYVINRHLSIYIFISTSLSLSLSLSLFISSHLLRFYLYLYPSFDSQSQRRRSTREIRNRARRMASRTKGKTTMEVGGDGVAVITLINPPVDSLSFDGTLCSSSTLFIYFWSDISWIRHLFTILDQFRSVFDSRPIRLCNF